LTSGHHLGRVGCHPGWAPDRLPPSVPPQRLVNTSSSCYSAYRASTLIAWNFLEFGSSGMIGHRCGDHKPLDCHRASRPYYLPSRAAAAISSIDFRIGRLFAVGLLRGGSVLTRAGAGEHSSRADRRTRLYGAGACRARSSTMTSREPNHRRPTGGAGRAVLPATKRQREDPPWKTQGLLMIVLGLILLGRTIHRTGDATSRTHNFARAWRRSLPAHLRRRRIEER